MNKPKRFLTRMTLFVVAVLALGIALSGSLIKAFMANAALNGVIVAMLLVGIFIAFRRVLALGPEIDWITAFRRADSMAGGTTGKPPRLMAPAAAMLSAQEDEAAMRLSALSTRSVLDGLMSRLDETRELSRYFTGLLIFLGLLGTFWGLLGTISSISETIKSLTVDGGDTALMFDSLKAGLESPLAGMGTAFSSSLFGLAGSLVLGFLDLQATQAQTRFFNDVEDWLSSVTQLSRGSDLGGEMASPGAYMTALMEQTADGIDKLQRTLTRGQEDGRGLNDAILKMGEALAGLGDRMAEQQTAQATMSDMHMKLAGAIDRLASEEQTAPAPVLDDASRQHLRNVDLGLKRLSDEQARASEMLVDDLRSELKLLSRTISASMDAARRPADQDGQD